MPVVATIGYCGNVWIEGPGIPYELRRMKKIEGVLEKTRSRRKGPKIDKSKLKYGEEERIDDKEYRQWIAGLPCAVTGITVDIQCAHIRHRSNTGGAQKPSDYGHCVPLFFKEHIRQHAMPETEYWAGSGGIESAQSLAGELYKAYLLNDRDMARELIRRFRHG